MEPAEAAENVRRIAHDYAQMARIWYELADVLETAHGPAARIRPLTAAVDALQVDIGRLSRRIQEGFIPPWVAVRRRGRSAPPAAPRP